MAVEHNNGPDQPRRIPDGRPLDSGNEGISGIPRPPSEESLSWLEPKNMAGDSPSIGDSPESGAEDIHGGNWLRKEVPGIEHLRDKARKIIAEFNETPKEWTVDEEGKPVKIGSPKEDTASLPITDPRSPYARAMKRIQARNKPQQPDGPAD